MGFFKDNTEKLMKEISKLEPAEFLGVCKIVGVPLYEEGEEKTVTVKDKDGKDVQMTYSARPRQFEDLWGDLCEKVKKLNRKQKRTLDQLVRAATKKEQK